MHLHNHVLCIVISWIHPRVATEECTTVVMLIMDTHKSWRWRISSTSVPFIIKCDSELMQFMLQNGVATYICVCVAHKIYWIYWNWDQSQGPLLHVRPSVRVCLYIVNCRSHLKSDLEETLKHLFHWRKKNLDYFRYLFN